MIDRRQLLSAVTAGGAILATRTLSAQISSIPVDSDTQRYEDLTASELVGMVIGIPLFLEGELHRGRRIIELSLDLEHLIATQPQAPQKPRPEALKEINELRTELLQLSGENVFLHILANTPVATTMTPHRTRTKGS